MVSRLRKYLGYYSARGRLADSDPRSPGPHDQAVGKGAKTLGRFEVGLELSVRLGFDRSATHRIDVLRGTSAAGLVGRVGVHQKSPSWWSIPRIFVDTHVAALMNASLAPNADDWPAGNPDPHDDDQPRTSIPKPAGSGCRGSPVDIGGGEPPSSQWPARHIEAIHLDASSPFE